MSGYVKYINDEDGNIIRVPDEERNISEIERIEKEIAALEVELAALKLENE
jgi:hypothetical protein